MNRYPEKKLEEWQGYFQCGHAFEMDAWRISFGYVKIHDFPQSGDLLSREDFSGFMFETLFSWREGYSLGIKTPRRIRFLPIFPRIHMRIL